MTDSSLDLPLKGLRVLDFAQFLAGPVAALRLADLGAEVIKIERPQGGDLCRTMVVNDQKLDDDSLVFHTFNRGKKSVTADLKNSDDLRKIRELITTSDVMINNFRPGVMERIGLGYDQMQQLNPRIIYGTVTGYGTTGPWRDKPGQDLLVQALSGISWLNGNADDGPVPSGFAMIDVATAANLVQGILACLVRRGVTGKGGIVEVDLLSSAIDVTSEQFTCFLNDGRQPRRHEIGNANPYQQAPYGVYETANGYLALAMTPLAQIAALLDTPEIASFRQNQAFTHLNEIKAVLAKVIIEKQTAYWLDIFEPKGIWCAPVLDWSEFVECDGFKALDPLLTIATPSGATAQTTRCPIRIDGNKLSGDKAAPSLGTDTDLVIGAMVTEDR